MTICAAIKNDDVNFMAMGQSYINNITEKRQIRKDYEQLYLSFVKTNLYLYTHESIEGLTPKH